MAEAVSSDVQRIYASDELERLSLWEIQFPGQEQGWCAQGIGAKVRDDENCEYQMERSVVVWNNTCINRCIGEAIFTFHWKSYDYDDDDDKVNQD